MSKTKQEEKNAAAAGQAPETPDLAAAVEAAEAAEAKIGHLVDEKMKAGLTREQATEVVRAQIKHDAKRAKETAKKG